MYRVWLAYSWLKSSRFRFAIGSTLWSVKHLAIYMFADFCSSPHRLCTHFICYDNNWYGWYSHDRARVYHSVKSIVNTDHRAPACVYYYNNYYLPVLKQSAEPTHRQVWSRCENSGPDCCASLHFYAATPCSIGLAVVRTFARVCCSRFVEWWLRSVNPAAPTIHRGPNNYCRPDSATQAGSEYTYLRRIQTALSYRVLMSAFERTLK